MTTLQEKKQLRAMSNTEDFHRLEIDYHLCRYWDFTPERFNLCSNPDNHCGLCTCETFCNDFEPYYILDIFG